MLCALWRSTLGAIIPSTVVAVPEGFVAVTSSVAFGLLLPIPIWEKVEVNIKKKSKEILKLFIFIGFPKLWM
jgi:hypothetical protein